MVVRQCGVVVEVVEVGGKEKLEEQIWVGGWQPRLSGSTTNQVWTSLWDVKSVPVGHSQWQHIAGVNGEKSISRKTWTTFIHIFVTTPSHCGQGWLWAGLRMLVVRGGGGGGGPRLFTGTSWSRSEPSQGLRHEGSRTGTAASLSRPSGPSRARGPVFLNWGDWGGGGGGIEQNWGGRRGDSGGWSSLVYNNVSQHWVTVGLVTTIRTPLWYCKPFNKYL